MLIHVFIVLFIIVVLSLVIFLSIYIPIQITNDRYRTFVNTHSEAIKELKKINEEYVFVDIPSFDMVHSYDNESYYDNISTKDYLTYQLQYIQKEVEKAIDDTSKNKTMYQQYNDDIKTRCIFNSFDIDELPKNQKRLEKIEKQEFKNKIQTPTVVFGIIVTLILTNINGVHKDSKSHLYKASDIKPILTSLKQKRGSFYLNDDIWQSICKVERGKVTNKMRFAIYNRDHNRCRICGSTRNLEIDHIIPIAKGGKTKYDNLQTLCHKCNVKKGDSVDYHK